MPMANPAMLTREYPLCLSRFRNAFLRMSFLQKQESRLVFRYLPARAQASWWEQAWFPSCVGASLDSRFSGNECACERIDVREV